MVLNANQKISLAEPSLDRSDTEAIVRVLQSGWLKQGEEVEQFEREFAQYIGTRFCVAVSSGTAALHLAFLAAGICSGDEIVMPSYSYISTANAALYVGAKPVFSDVDRTTLTMDPISASDSISDKTKALLVVHWAGLPADLGAFQEIASDNRILLIEDAAQAHGAIFRDRMAGSFGDISCFSFSTAKNMTTGEGGAVLTNVEAIASRVRSLRNLGESSTTKNQYVELGFNYRMTDLQAALGRNQLRKLEGVIQRKRTHLNALGRELSGMRAIRTPIVPSDRTHVFTMYPTLIAEMIAKCNAHDLVAALAARGIEARTFTSLHQQPVYKTVQNVRLPVTDEVSSQSVYLPAPATITTWDVKRVSSALRELLG